MLKTLRRSLNKTFYWFLLLPPINLALIDNIAQAQSPQTSLIPAQLELAITSHDFMGYDAASQQLIRSAIVSNGNSYSFL
ncbi:hypothetical protein I4641_15375 [Waterburya agarophytonicola K14]|uniref:Uncharacterized protein n=1 Tax=Waterburya agarophytonicola KI4 TaxID=2874699 RepID=A0A964FGT7_9CYAN|nr:hypothetical protein [Waterburya agarophytonicola]MCC0178362.1 hypothetical protein [Waterburya agarophytonicola KI4]